MRSTLVLGINGQDGSYVGEALLRRGCRVVGIGLDPTSRHISPQPGFCYRRLDLTDLEAFRELVEEISPDLAFCFAAIHGAIEEGFTYEEAWRRMMEVNVFTLHVLLEHARQNAPEMRIVYAGSAKIFPSPLSGQISEQTIMRPTCLYGIGKLTARDLMQHYRRTHGIFSTNLILFNHDSARRTRQFFLPKIAETIREAKRDRTHRRTFRTLDFRIDWSAADEIMDFIVDYALADQDVPEFIVASGQTVNARDAMSGIFAAHQLDVASHVIQVLPPHDPGPEFQVDITRFVDATGRTPKKTVADIVGDLLKSMAAEPSIRAVT